jgi:hypothetical protein
MRNRLPLVILLAVLVLALSGWTLSAQKPPRIQWEYQTIAVKTVSRLPPDSAEVDRALETFGKGGWELAAAESYSVGGENLTRLYFKRQK